MTEWEKFSDRPERMEGVEYAYTTFLNSAPVNTTKEELAQVFSSKDVALVATPESHGFVVPTSIPIISQWYVKGARDKMLFSGLFVFITMITLSVGAAYSASRIGRAVPRDAWALLATGLSYSIGIAYRLFVTRHSNKDAITRDLQFQLWETHTKAKYRQSLMGYGIFIFGIASVQNIYEVVLAFYLLRLVNEDESVIGRAPLAILTALAIGASLTVSYFLQPVWAEQFAICLAVADLIFLQQLFGRASETMPTQLLTRAIEKLAVGGCILYLNITQPNLGYLLGTGIVIGLVASLITVPRNTQLPAPPTRPVQLLGRISEVVIFCAALAFLAFTIKHWIDGGFSWDTFLGVRRSTQG